MMRQVLCGLLALMVLLTACADERDVIEETPATPKPCTGSEVTDPNPRSEESWTWLDITVGVSTIEDVEVEFGEPTLTYMWTDDKPQACIYKYTNYDDLVIFWIASDRVIGIEFRPALPYPPYFRMSDQPQTQNHMRELYGRPDLVGWSGLRYGVRSAVWISEGIQADISTHGLFRIRTIRYFAPMTEDQFKNSVWSELILDYNPTMDGVSDLVDMAPIDPFEW